MGHIINLLGFQKVYARWVPRKLTDEVKAERLRVSREVWGHFEEEGLGFLQQLVIGDETWDHHYDPEYKRHSTEYYHKASPVPKKYKTKVSAGKIMLNVFLHSEGVVLFYFLEKGATVNSENYIEMLKNLTKSIMRSRAETDVCINKTMPGLKQVPPQLMPSHIWGLQCYHIQPTVRISLLGF